MGVLFDELFFFLSAQYGPYKWVWFCMRSMNIGIKSNQTCCIIMFLPPPPPPPPQGA